MALNPYATKLSEGFAQKVMEIFYASSVTDVITNSDYEGEIKDNKSVLNILTFGALTTHPYTGANMTVDDILESNGQLLTNQQKYIYFRVKSLNKFQAWIKNPENTLLTQTANQLKKDIDTYILGLYTKVAAGNRVGSDYTTGTVAVDGSGNVTGTGTTFTAAMVGRGFKASGQTAWSRVATYTSATVITIVDDLDDAGAGGYSQGVVSAGATFTIEAVTPIQVTATTVYSQINTLSQKLSDLEIPEEDRWLVVPPYVASMIRQSAQFNLSVDAAFEDVIKRGLLGEIAGFTCYKTARVVGDSVNGWHIMAGHKSAITYAMGYTETGIEDLIGNFGKAYKGLNIYGAKVVDQRRLALTEFFCKA